MATEEIESKGKRRRRRGGKRKQAGDDVSTVSVTPLDTKKDIAVQDLPNKGNRKISSKKSSLGDVVERKKTKGKKKIKAKIPGPGEEGYLTPTQLRNARKRRAKQRFDEPTKNDHNKSIDYGKKKKILGAGKGDADPSQKYLKDPKSCPAVRTAKQFFQTRLPASRTFDIFLGPLTGWRTVSKLAVRRSKTDPTSTMPDIGLFAFGTHEIASHQSCPAHHESINASIKVVREACSACHVVAYDEQDGSGLLRYLAVNVERQTGAVQITLVWNSKPNDMEKGDPDSKPLRKLIRYLKRADGNESSFVLHSLWVHFHSSWKHDNAIFGREEGSWKLVHGVDAIDEVLNLNECKTLPEVHLQFAPNVFRQANLDAFTNIIQSIRRYLEEYVKTTCQECRCVELYGGVGTIGLHVADLMTSFVSSDENPHNLNCFNTAVASIASKRVRKKIQSYVPKNALDMVNAGALNNAEICIVDPPRKGLESGVASALTAQGPVKLLVYVSCGFEAFQRDCQMLVNGGWRLMDAEGHILFPGADAIESLAFFRRD